MMNSFPSRAVVESLRRNYPEGTRVALVSMDDPYTKLLPGDQGTVIAVDDVGNHPHPVEQRIDAGRGVWRGRDPKAVMHGDLQAA